MKSSKVLSCYNCGFAILRLSDYEIKKLDGLNFQCECCGHENHLSNFELLRGTNGNDPYVNILSLDQVLPCN